MTHVTSFRGYEIFGLGPIFTNCFAPVSPLWFVITETSRLLSALMKGNQLGENSSINNWTWIRKLSPEFVLSVLKKNFENNAFSFACAEIVLCGHQISPNHSIHTVSADAWLEAWDPFYPSLDIKITKTHCKLITGYENSAVTIV